MKNLFKICAITLFSILFTNTSFGQELSKRSFLDSLSNAYSIQYKYELDLAMAEALKNGWSTVGLERLDRNGNPLYIFPTNNVAAGVTNTINLRTSKSVNGQGMKMGIWEAATTAVPNGGIPLLTHQDFQTNGVSRITIMDGTAASNHTFHATHVAGTLIGNPPSGAGISSTGMAPFARLDAYTAANDNSEIANAAAVSIDEVSAGNLLVSQHSYGFSLGWRFNSTNNGWDWLGGTNNFIGGGSDPNFGAYFTADIGYDNIALNAPYYLLVKSAGNEANDNPNPSNALVRNGTSGSYVAYNTNIHPLGDGVYAGGFNNLPGGSSAKNILTVGAVNNNNIIAAFSSRGPMVDGRIKPDIVGMGVNLNSASNTTNTAYGLSSGTSMSGPNVAGSLLLLQEYYRDRYKVGNDSLFMKNSTLKALAINTATDLGNSGPDYTYGFGILNADKAGDVIEADAWIGGTSDAVIIEDSIMTVNDVFEYEINYDASNELKITLVYNDHAADTLVNDLDMLLIQHSTNGVFRSWRLDKDNPANNAVKADNDVDNVEHMSWPGGNPLTGTYTLRVSVEDPDTLFQNKPVLFSLIIDGLNPSCRSSIQHKLLDLPSDTYTAKEYIKSQAKLVTAGREINYQTNGKIELKPGFYAKAQTSTGAGYFKTSSGTCP